MNFQFDVNAQHSSPTPVTAETASIQTVDLLRQILEVQKEHLAVTRAVHDAISRWRAFLNRWHDDFPELPRSCRDVLPVLEKAYGGLIEDLAGHLRDQETDGLGNEYALQEFLDRYGMRLAQVGTLLNLVGPLAEASAQNEAT